MKKVSYFPVLYMFIVTAVFSAILILFSDFTRERVEQNAQFDFEKAVVSVLPVDIDVEQADQAEIHQIFVSQVKKPETDGEAYKLVTNGTIQGYALPIEGKGFWAPIKGMLGVAPDKKTITGISFHEQNETPGLGAEITQPQFKQQFQKEKNRILAQTDKPLIIARPGTELGQNEVHGVTGATQTSKRLQQLINEDVTKWRENLQE